MKRLRAVNQLPLTFKFMSLQKVPTVGSSCSICLPRQRRRTSPASHKDTFPQELGPVGNQGLEKHPQPTVSINPGAAFLLPITELMSLTNFSRVRGTTWGTTSSPQCDYHRETSKTASGMTHPSSEGLAGAPLPALTAHVAKEQGQIRCCNSPSAEFRPAGAPTVPQ